MTIIYLKLKYCEYAYGLFEKILQDKRIQDLGFPGVAQERCCCVCDGNCSNVVDNVPKTVKPRLRTVPADNKTVLNELISSELRDFEAQTNSTSLMLFSFPNEKKTSPVVEQICADFQANCSLPVKSTNFSVVQVLTMTNNL